MMVEVGLTLLGNVAAVVAAYSQIMKRLAAMEHENAVLNKRLTELSDSVALLLERRKRDRLTGEENP